MECSGVVVKSNSDKFKVGDKVVAFTNVTDQGSYAQYVNVNDSNVAIKPDQVDFKVAAALPIGVFTIDNAFTTSKLKSGQKILILGSSGGNF